MKYENKFISKVCIEETLQERKSMQRIAHSGEKRGIYNVLKLCNEEKKNRSLIIPPERAVAMAANAVGKNVWI